jgi:RNA polymerase sigma-70 factor (ECF subfamily)
LKHVASRARPLPFALNSDFRVIFEFSAFLINRSAARSSIPYREGRRFQPHDPECEMPAWDEIEPHIPALFRYLLRLTGDLHEAEDLTQETTIRAWKRRRQLKNEQYLKVWMLRIARNLACDEHRKQRRRPVLESGVEDRADPLVPTPEQIAMLSEEEERISALVDSLPKQQREVMHLSAVEGLELAEIADVLGISRNSAKVSLYVARKTIREALFPIRQTPTQQKSRQ